MDEPKKSNDRIKIDTTIRKENDVTLEIYTTTETNSIQRIEQLNIQEIERILNGHNKSEEDKRKKKILTGIINDSKKKKIPEDIDFITVLRKKKMQKEVFIADKNLSLDIKEKMKKILDSPKIDMGNKNLSEEIERRYKIDIGEDDISKYFTGTAQMPFVFIFAFCEITNTRFEDLFYPEMETPEDKVINAIKPFLQSVFSDGRFIHDMDTQRDSFNSLFEKGKDELKLNFIYLSLKARESDNLAENKILQSGKLLFKKQGQGICRLTYILDEDNHGNKDVIFKGFSIITNPDTNDGNCWCFLKRDDNYAATFCVISFRLPTDLDSHRYSGNKWNARIAEAITSRITDSSPTIYNMLLSKPEITPKMKKYFIGHLKLNGGQIQIAENTLNSTINELPYDISSEQSIKYNNFIKLLTELNLKSDIYTLDLHNEDIKDFLDENPLWLSLLNKYSLTFNNNRLSEDTDKEIEDLFKEFKTRKIN